MRLPALLAVFGLSTFVGCVVEDNTPYDTYGTGGSCDIGSEGCSCTSGGECNPGYFCDNNQNICLLDTCPVGTETCACTPKGACDPGLMCASDICVDPGMMCPAGTEGCPCTEGGGCDPMLECLSGTCVDASGVDTGDSGGTSTGSTDTGGCNPDDCEVWVCGEAEPDCPCDCEVGCTDNSAINCGDPAPCVTIEDCTANSAVCDSDGTDAVCVGADGTGG